MDKQDAGAPAEQSRLPGAEALEVLEALPQAAFVCGADGRLRWVNRHFAGLLGCEPVDVRGLPLASLAVPQDRASVAALVFMGIGHRSPLREGRARLRGASGDVSLAFRLAFVPDVHGEAWITGLAEPARATAAGPDHSGDPTATEGAGTPAEPGDGESRYREALRQEMRASVDALTAELSNLLALCPEDHQELLIRGAMDRVRLLSGTFHDVLDFDQGPRPDVCQDLDFDLRAMLEGICSPEHALDIDARAPSCLKGRPGHLRRILNECVATLGCKQGESLRLSVQRIHEDEDSVLLLLAITAPPGTAGAAALEAPPMARRLTHWLGGVLGAEEDPACGRTLWLRLSCRKGVRPAESPEELQVAGCRVLCAVLPGAARPELMAMLRRLGAESQVADSAPAAIARLALALHQGRPMDAVLVDLALPHMGAMEIARRVREREGLARTPLVLMANVGQPGDAAWARAQGFSAYLVQPLEESVLAGVLMRARGGAMGGRDGSAILTRHSLAEAKRPRLRVLVVDDDPTNQIALSAALERMGCSVDLASTGSEAIGYFSRESYGLILLDVRLPDINGDRVARFMREGERRRGCAPAPIIAMTACARETDRDLCLQAGADGYWEKPITIDRLHALISAAPVGVASVANSEAARRVPGTTADQVAPQGKEGDPVAAPGDAIDLEHLELVTLGDPALRAEVLQTFLSELRSSTQHLSRARSRGDLERMGRVLDSAYGLCATVGAWKMAHLIESLERGLSTLDPAGIEGAVGQILAEVGPLTTVIRGSGLLSSADEASHEIDHSDVSDRLGSIRLDAA